ncbi:DUF4240 domain-containing protein [Kribbella sp. NPDC051718]|uniref:DUF4240 domain-containing protein n=1 Tax=Kribbella sp. NPDC051718 TaxID=3155168 RepID=UPI0034240A23
MDENTFWALVEASREASDNSLEDQAEHLGGALLELGQDQVVAFDAVFTEASRAIYSWEHVGAASVMLGWVGDDTFTDFRSWVIAQGRTTYERFRADPDSIVDAGLDDQEELGAAEMYAGVAAEVFAELAGGEIWDLLPEREGVEFQEDLAGVRFVESVGVMAERYPRLTAVYGPFSSEPKDPVRNDR